MPSSPQKGGEAQWRETPPTGTRLAPSSSLEEEGDRGFKDPLPGGGARPGVSPLIFFPPKTFVFVVGQKNTQVYTTLSGGSLGSCVDEERS